MATTYKYTVLDEFGEDRWSIQYNITPDFGTPVYPGDLVTISGRARNTVFAIKSIGLFYDIEETGWAYTNVSIKKGSWGTFSIAFTVPASAYATLPSSKQYGVYSKALSFGIYGQVDCGAGFDIGTLSNSDTTQRLTLGKYHLDPAITSVSFERTNASGTAANDGQYVTCRKLCLALNSQASAGDVTKKTISITAEGSSSPLRTVTLSTQLSSMLSASGYRETSPSLFSGLQLDLGKEYYIDITIGDAYDTTTYHYTLNRAFCLVDFARKKNGGFSIGMYSNSTDDYPLFEVAESHESRFYSEAVIGDDGQLHGGTNIVGINSYQEGEHLTGGTWIDGKPIYRYLLNFSTTKTNVNNEPIGTLPSIPDTIVSISGIVNREAVGAVYSLNFETYNNATGYAVNIKVQQATGEIQIGIGANITGTKSGHVIIEYTKADSSSSDAPLPGPKIIDNDSIYIDVGVARADYIGMMTGIEIPTNSETKQLASTPSEQPTIGDEPLYSQHYDLVLRYYKYNCWNEAMVNNAIGKWITSSEAQSILSQTQVT